MDRDDIETETEAETETETERDRLIAAAWSILERTDFAGLKVQRVAIEAGVSMRAFYRHFADKDALLLVLMGEEMQRSAPRLARVVARANSPQAGVRAWIMALIGAATDPARVHRAHLFTELTPILARQHHEPLDTAERELWRPLLEAIEAGYADGTFRGGDPVGDALVIFNLSGACLRSALTAEGPAAIDRMIETTIDFAMRALTAPSPP